jgi:hypothetical protein
MPIPNVQIGLHTVLWEPAPARILGTRGLPRSVGNALPSLQQVLAASDAQWESITPDCWYGHRHKQLGIVTGTAVWYHGGAPAVSLCWVLVQDRMGCTDQQASASHMLNWVLKGRQIEVTFEQAGAHLRM